MIQLKNDLLKIGISPLGAELRSIIHQQHDINYLWTGDTRFWGKFAPVLFPIVGALKEDSYIFDGSTFSLGRHGFARDKEFTLLSNDETIATFELNSDAETLRRYPFEFILRITYRLQNDTLITTYHVMNKSEGDLYFSIGAHPAFSIPIGEGLRFEDYYLEFETPEITGRWPLENNLIGQAPLPLLNHEQKLPLNHDLFRSDAIVLKELRSTSVSLRSDKSERGITCHFEGFPYLGIWSAPEAPFICIEPWCGIADSVDHNQQLTEKEGIISLGKNKHWERSFSLRFF